MSTECVICLEVLNSDSVRIPCNHSFHRHCINSWLRFKKECPVCRQSIETDLEAQTTSIPNAAQKSILKFIIAVNSIYMFTRSVIFFKDTSVTTMVYSVSTIFHLRNKIDFVLICILVAFILLSSSPLECQFSFSPICFEDVFFISIVILQLILIFRLNLLR